MFNIILADKIEDASLPVRWSIHNQKEFEARIGEPLHLCFPHMVFDVCYPNVYQGNVKVKSAATYRYLFPVSQVMGYLPLLRSGEVKIRASIAWWKNPRLSLSAESDFKAKLLQRGFEEHKTSFEHYSMDPRVLSSNIFGFIDTYPEQKIMVPDVVFAKYPDWVVAIANKFSDGVPATDQCTVRQRLIVNAFTVPMVWVSILFTKIFVTVAFASIGYRVNLGWLRPSRLFSLDLTFDVTYADTVGELPHKLEYNYLFDRKEIKSAGKVFWYPSPYAIFCPALLGSSTLAFWLMETGPWHIVIPAGVAYSIVTIGVVYAWVAFCLFLLLSSIHILSRIQEALHTKPIFQFLPKPVSSWFDRYADYLYRKIDMPIQKSTKEEDPFHIRWQDKSFRLIFAELKRRVCKPLELQ